METEDGPHQKTLVRTLRSRILERLAFFKLYWKNLLVVSAFFLYLPVFLINDTSENRCLYVVLLMATFWATEALPLPITSMFPIVFFPVLGIMDTKTICPVYMSETIVMFIGGIAVALAVEYCNLHTRVALTVIKMIGCSQKKLHFGLLAVTMFMSMWISNVACASLMCPIAVAVLEQLELQGLCKMYIDQPRNETNEAIEISNDRDQKRPTRITLCYLLGAAYASSIGGIGTLIGSGPNLVLLGIYENNFLNAESLDFPTFMACSVPIMLLITFFTWMWLQCLYMGMFRPNSVAAKEGQIGKEGVEIARATIELRHKDLGSMSTQEKCVGLLFIVSIILLITRKPGIFKGWAELITTTQLQGASVFIFVLILIFIFPINCECFKFCKPNPGQLPTQSGPALMPWKYLQAKMPWGLLFLLGGGMGIAAGGKESGLSSLLGKSLNKYTDVSPLVLLLIVCLFVKVITEFTSNVAVASILLPIIGELSVQKEMHPLYLMIPVAIMCSFAFHLPVGTPPNALVSIQANIHTKDMAIAGIGPTVVSLICIIGIFPLWMNLIYPGLAQESG